MVTQQVKTLRNTSALVAKLMYDVMPYILQGCDVLETSAGSGRLLDFMCAIELKKVLLEVPKDKIDCLETNDSKRGVLIEKGYNVIGKDFLGCPIDKKYDLIISAPPFKNSNDVLHIMKMHSLLKYGGFIIALTKPLWMFDNRPMPKAFRTFLKDKHYSLKLLPDYSFIESHKTMTTAILKMERVK